MKTILVDEIIYYDTSNIVASYDMTLQPAPEKKYLRYVFVSQPFFGNVKQLVCYRADGGYQE
jgi:hypothetical protein